VLAIGITQLDSTGLANAESFRNTPGSVVGEDALARHFVAGAGNPVAVVSTPESAAAVRTARMVCRDVAGCSR